MPSCPGWTVATVLDHLARDAGIGRATWFREGPQIDGMALMAGLPPATTGVAARSLFHRIMPGYVELLRATDPDKRCFCSPVRCRLPTCSGWEPLRTPRVERTSIWHWAYTRAPADPGDRRRPAQRRVHAEPLVEAAQRTRTATAPARSDRWATGQGRRRHARRLRRGHDDGSVVTAVGPPGQQLDHHRRRPRGRRPVGPLVTRSTLLNGALTLQRGEF